MIMKSEYTAVIKVKECPVCGATNRVMYGFNELAVEGSCGFCGSVVRWKRKVSVAGTSIRMAVESEEPELVTLDRYDQGGEQR